MCVSRVSQCFGAFQCRRCKTAGRLINIANSKLGFSVLRRRMVSRLNHSSWCFPSFETSNCCCCCCSLSPECRSRARDERLRSKGSHQPTVVIFIVRNVFLPPREAGICLFCLSPVGSRLTRSVSEAVQRKMCSFQPYFSGNGKR